VDPARYGLAQVQGRRPRPPAQHIFGFYRSAEDEGSSAHSPAVHIRRLRIDDESHVAHLDRNELGVILVTASSPPPLNAGVPLRDVQEAPSHADPRMTMRSDRGRHSLDPARHVHRCHVHRGRLTLTGLPIFGAP